MIKESLEISIDTLKHRKTSSILTILGIVVGISSIIALLSVGVGLEKSVLEQLEGIGSDKIISRILAAMDEGETGAINRAVVSIKVSAVR